MTSATQLHQDVPIVVFTLGGRAHAVELERVGEVLRMVAITSVPESPAWVAGVVNLRGRPVPVADLRRRLDTGSAEIGLATPMIIATAAGGTVGLIVDAVIGLRTLPAAALGPPGGSGAVAAVADVDGMLVAVLDLDRVCEGIERVPVRAA